MSINNTNLWYWPIMDVVQAVTAFVQVTNVTFSSILYILILKMKSN